MPKSRQRAIAKVGVRPFSWLLIPDSDGNIQLKSGKYRKATKFSELSEDIKLRYNTIIRYRGKYLVINRPRQVSIDKVPLVGANELSIKAYLNANFHNMKNGFKTCPSYQRQKMTPKKVKA